MWASLLFNHPIEMMVLNLVAALPLMFAIFTLAAVAQRISAKTPFLMAVKVGTTLTTAVLFGGAVFIDRMFVAPYYKLNDSLTAFAFSDPFAVIFPMFLALAIVLVRNNWARAALALAGTAIDLTIVDGFPNSHVFSVVPQDQWLYIVMSVTAGACLLAIGVFHVSTKSYVNRAVGALATAWGMKLLSFSMMSAHRPATSIVAESSGVISPNLIIGFTIMLVGAALVAYFEHKRLQSSAYRSAIVQESEKRMRLLAEATQEAIVVEREGIVEDANAVFRKLVNVKDPVGQRLTTWLPAEGSERRRKEDRSEKTAKNCVLHGARGREIPIELHTTEMGDGRIVYAMRDLTEFHHNEARIRNLADNDALTGIANRRSFDEALKRAVRLAENAGASGDKTSCLALIMIDLDRFKPVNDTYGHAVGDKLLRDVTKRFADAVRPDDVLARIGGDEFALIAWVADEEGGSRLADRLCNAARSPFAIDGMSISIGASSGLALFDTEIEPNTVELLQQCADIALYRAKDGGRGHAVMFRSEMRKEESERLQLEDDLRHALDRNEIVLHYQPQHDVRSGQVVGYEALMRWTHPTMGAIPPSTFIPIAEETGIIIALGRWALGRAMADFAAFDFTTRVAINVSPMQFTSSDLVADVRHALKSTGFDPKRLELEVTEQLLIDDTVTTLKALMKLREMGVSLALDDFGSGYSSLAYLTRFPFSKIKIDGSFINAMMTDERARTLVKSMMALANALDLRVTAEGVETHGQLLQLAQQSCDEAQGYLLGRPQPMCDLRAKRGMSPAEKPYRLTA